MIAGISAAVALTLVILAMFATGWLYKAMMSVAVAAAIVSSFAVEAGL